MLREAVQNRKQTVTIVVQLADRTRSAQVTLPRTMRVSDLLKVCRKKWALSFGVDYQVANMTQGRQLMQQDTLTYENVHNGDTLMLQPFAVHGSF